MALLVLASRVCQQTVRGGFVLGTSSHHLARTSRLSNAFSQVSKPKFKISNLPHKTKTSNPSLLHRAYERTPITYIGCLCTGVIAGRTLLSSAYCGLKLSHKSTSLSKPKLLKKTEEDTPPEFHFGEFLNLLWPDIWLLILASLSAFAVAMTNIQLPLLLGSLVNVVSSLATGEHSRDYFDVLKIPALKMVGLYAVQSGLTFVYIALLSCLGERIAERMRTALFSSLVRQDIAFFDAHKTGELINRLTADVQDFKSSFKQCISQGLRSTTQSIGCICAMYFISPKLTGLMLLVLPAVIITGALFGSLLRRLSRQAQEQVAKATAVADEALGNVRTVRAFAMEEKETDLYAKEVGRSKTLNELLGVGIGAFQGMANFAINGLVLVVLYAGGSMMAVQELKPGDLISFLVATQTIQRSLGSISVLFGQIIRGMSAGARVFEYLLIQPSIPVIGGRHLPIKDIQGQVDFHTITFTYPTRPNHVVLRDFSLHIPAGKMVALCGPSGSGKSTVAALLERFYEVGSGTVTLDGHDIRQLDPTWLRGGVIGYIHQEPLLFSTSVFENIRYGRPDATDEEVFEAAKQANADGFIRNFPEGYGTNVGERGVTLSGGQRQRVAIARALLKNPPILILDEATSALDAESERLVQEALDRLTEGRTVIVIAHRLSTIQGADKIVVLSHGKIQESGTHQELMRMKGLYAELVRRQMQDQDEDDDE